jgi:hypothetical protein
LAESYSFYLARLAHYVPSNLNTKQKTRIVVAWHKN